MARESEEKEWWRAFEPYLPATRTEHGAANVGGSLYGLHEVLNFLTVYTSELEKSKDAVDAAVCVLSAADFLLGRAIAAADHEIPQLEGGIFAADE